ncbi:metallophosphoesterase [Paenibacillus sp. CC-CFT747]|nr:metallophosphoesterase [Paenibacillus sp. CC-CFT747]
MKKQWIAAVLLCGLCGFTVRAGAAPEDPILSFPVLSDIHVQSGDAKSQRKFKAALEDLAEINPGANTMVINGDLGNGRPSDYGVLSEILESTDHPPIHFTIGNHEFYKAYLRGDSWNPDGFPNGETEQASINRFLTFTGMDKLYHDAWIKDYHFIFLGSEQFRQSNPDNGDDAYLSETQLSWLKEKLQEGAELNKPIFVFLHQPLPFTVTGSNEARGVVQHKELKQILDAYPQVIMFNSHTHYLLGSPNSVYRDRFLMVNTSSASEPWSVKAGPLDGDESEGLVVQVFPNAVVLKGRDFASKQWISYAQYVIPTGNAGSGG